jgi:hypothetical protein
MILATEFVWAERLLERVASRAASASRRATATRTSLLAVLGSTLLLVVVGLGLMVAVPRLRLVGLSAVVAGVISAACMHPAAQGRLERRTRSIRSDDEASERVPEDC